MVDFMNALGFYLVVIFLPLYMQVWGRGHSAYRKFAGRSASVTVCSFARQAAC